MSPTEVVGQAKASGIKLTPQLVYNVRRSAKKKKPAKAASTAKKPVSSTPTPKSNPPSKSKFLRGIPPSVSAKDVLPQGKAAGLKIHVNQASKVEGRGDAATKKVAAKTISKPPKDATAETKSKADFVRTYPSLSAKEVVAKAAAEGIKLGWRYVYNVRASDKAPGRKKRAPTKATIPTATAVNGAAPSIASAVRAASAEDLLRAVAAELGLGRAVEILAGERARVRTLIGG
jgi:hypothetical protein